MMNAFRFVSVIYADLRKALQSKFVRTALLRAYSRRLAAGMSYVCIVLGVILFIFQPGNAALFFAMAALFRMQFHRMDRWML